MRQERCRKIDRASRHRRECVGKNTSGVREELSFEDPDLGITRHEEKTRGREKVTPRREKINWYTFLSRFIPLFSSHLASPSSLFPFLSRLALVTCITEDRPLPDRSAATSITSDGQQTATTTTTATTNSGSPEPRRETRHNGRNKWRSFIPAVVIIKW